MLAITECGFAVAFWRIIERHYSEDLLGKLSTRILVLRNLKDLSHRENIDAEATNSWIVYYGSLHGLGFM